MKKKDNKGGVFMKKWIVSLFFFQLLFLSGCQHAQPTKMNKVPGFPPGHELNPLPGQDPSIENQGIQPLNLPSQTNEDRFYE